MAIFLNLRCPPSPNFTLFILQPTVTVQISRISWFQMDLEPFLSCIPCIPYVFLCVYRNKTYRVPIKEFLEVNVTIGICIQSSKCDLHVFLWMVIMEIIWLMQFRDKVKIWGISYYYNVNIELFTTYLKHPRDIIANHKTIIANHKTWIPWIILRVFTLGLD